MYIGTLSRGMLTWIPLRLGREGGTGWLLRIDTTTAVVQAKVKLQRDVNGNVFSFSNLFHMKSTRRSIA